MSITVGILTISDSCAEGRRIDLGGPKLAEMAANLDWSLKEQTIVPDEQAAIESVLKNWADEKSIDLILTTGGTGLSPRDVTPEATRRVIERALPGIPELMRQEGLRHTAMAPLSRAEAGTRKKSLIINFPGSPEGAGQSLNAVLHLITHALDIIKGAGHTHAHR